MVEEGFTLRQELFCPLAHQCPSPLITVMGVDTERQMEKQRGEVVCPRPDKGSLGGNRARTLDVSLAAWSVDA